MNSQKKIFAFDLHNVIFNYDYYSAFKLLFTEFPIKELFWILVHPLFVWELFITSRKTRVLDDIFEQVEKKYPRGSKLWPFGYKLANCQYPDKKNIELINRLKKNGYKIYLFSNIGPVSLDDLKIKYPEVFKIFDGIFTPKKEKNYMQKSNLEFFQNFKRFVKSREDSNFIILIDDRIKNIKIAKSQDIESVRFINSKKLESYLYKNKFIY